MTSSITQLTSSSTRSGKVWLVGAGPGDADLLTVKALRIIQQADLILYDRLVSEEIRALFPAQTAALFVGKSKNHHSVPQDTLNHLLVEKAREGLNICRLKGGDPFIFGRGSEEMLVVRDAGIDVEVVPGITAASGATSYAGIPLTHRGLSQACSFITGHGADGLDLNWSALAQSGHTLVFYMGLSKLGEIQQQLIQHGLAAATPAALIENGTRADQRVVTGPLRELASLAETHAIQSPALIVVGEVTRLAHSLAWFSQPELPICTALSA